MSTLVINLFISLRTYFIYLHSFIITVITYYHCYYYYNYYIYISVWQIIALAGTPAVPFWALNNYLGVLLLPQLTGHQIQIWPMQSRSLELYRCSIYPWCKLANQRLRPAACGRNLLPSIPRRQLPSSFLSCPWIPATWNLDAVHAEWWEVGKYAWNSWPPATTRLWRMFYPCLV